MKARRQVLEPRFYTKAGAVSVTAGSTYSNTGTGAAYEMAGAGATFSFTRAGAVSVTAGSTYSNTGTGAAYEMAGAGATYKSADGAGPVKPTAGAGVTCSVRAGRCSQCFTLNSR